MLLRKRSNVSDGRRRERRRALERACWRSMCEIIFQKKKRIMGASKSCISTHGVKRNETGSNIRIHIRYYHVLFVTINSARKKPSSPITSVPRKLLHSPIDRRY